MLKYIYEFETMRMMKNYFKIVPLLAIGLAFISCDTEPADAPAPLASTTIVQAKGAEVHQKALADVRKATARYHRLATAEAEGYVLASPCVSSPIGGMGHHYINFGLVDGVADPLEPEVLVYEPQKNGTMKLVAVEFIVPAAAWTSNTPPMLGSQPYEDHRNDPETNYGGPDFPNFQIHAWVWQNNPLGMHAPFNPTVTCDFAAQE